MHETLSHDQVHNAVARALEGRHLLEHPFYRRWEAGELHPDELRAYAAQYRHIERALPDVLEAVADMLPPGEARDLVTANLTDERGVPAPHVDLFEGFAAAVGAPADAHGATPAPSPATAALVELQYSAAAGDPVAAVAVVAAYEVQAAAIALTKSAGLASHYGVDAGGTRFWDVHAEMEADHAGWSLDVLALLSERPEEIAVPARAAADAWWAFLDEREALAPAPA